MQHFAELYVRNSSDQALMAELDLGQVRFLDGEELDAADATAQAEATESRTPTELDVLIVTPTPVRPVRRPGGMPLAVSF
jgi:hypothetical protein